MSILTVTDAKYNTIAITKKQLRIVEACYNLRICPYKVFVKEFNLLLDCDTVPDNNIGSFADLFDLGV